MYLLLRCWMTFGVVNFGYILLSWNHFSKYLGAFFLSFFPPFFLLSLFLMAAWIRHWVYEYITISEPILKRALLCFLLSKFSETSLRQQSGLNLRSRKMSIWLRNAPAALLTLRDYCNQNVMHFFASAFFLHFYFLHVMHGAWRRLEGDAKY